MALPPPNRGSSIGSSNSTSNSSSNSNGRTECKQPLSQSGRAGFPSMAQALQSRWDRDANGNLRVSLVELQRLITDFRVVNVAEAASVLRTLSQNQSRIVGFIASAATSATVAAASSASLAVAGHSTATEQNPAAQGSGPSIDISPFELPSGRQYRRRSAAPVVNQAPNRPPRPLLPGVINHQWVHCSSPGCNYFGTRIHRHKYYNPALDPRTQPQSQLAPSSSSSIAQSHADEPAPTEQAPAAVRRPLGPGAPPSSPIHTSISNSADSTDHKRLDAPISPPSPSTTSTTRAPSSPSPARDLPLPEQKGSPVPSSSGKRAHESPVGNVSTSPVSSPITSPVQKRARSGVSSLLVGIATRVGDALHLPVPALLRSDISHDQQ
jgi:hypothetical protein